MIVPNRGFGSAGDPGAGSPFFGNKLLSPIAAMTGCSCSTTATRSSGSTRPRDGRRHPAASTSPTTPSSSTTGGAIISNQEDNDTIVEIAYPVGAHHLPLRTPADARICPGYLNTPDDAYLLGNGQMTVADPGNCRVVIIDPRTKRVVHQIGTPGRCLHDPPPRSDRRTATRLSRTATCSISEINGSWIDELTPSGRRVWAVHLDIGYPSDAQQLGPDRYLVADYERPGGIVEFDRRGRIDYRYQPTSGPGKLDHPSLVELLPSGVFMATTTTTTGWSRSTRRPRRSSGSTAWTGSRARRPGLLNTPDGFDLLAPGGKTPTHPTTG